MPGDRRRGTGARLRRGARRAGHRPRGRGGRDLRLPRPQRRRQDDDGADADDAAAADRRPGHASPATTWSREARAVRASIGVALQEAALDPLMTGRELIRLQATLQGLPAGRGPRARRRPARTGRPGRRRRPPRRHLLGRDEAPARPRRRAGPRTARALPRRADHRPRPGQPQDDLGGGAGAERRRHHRLPHHPVPGGGRPARRQRRRSSTAAGSSPRARRSR